MKNIRKLLALVLALVMALMCAAASAATVEIRTSVDADALKTTMNGFGMPESQLAAIEPGISLMNSLCLKITTLIDGGEVALSLNEKNALTIGFGGTEEGLAVVSSLIPNCKLIVDRQTVLDLMKQAAANNPALAGIMGMMTGETPLPAMPANLETYIQEFTLELMTSAVPGESETGEFEFEGLKFDTKNPINIDMEKITAAISKLADNLLTDKEVTDLIGQFTAMMGENAPTIDAIREGVDRFITLLPEKVNAEYYTSAEMEGVIYIKGDATHKDAAEPAHYFTLLSAGSRMKMTYTSTEAGIDVLLDQNSPDNNGVILEVRKGEMIDFIIRMTMESGEIPVYVIDLYLNSENPLVTIRVAVDQNGERTLPIDTEGLTPVLLKDLISNGEGEAANALKQDLLQGVMKMMSEVPEIASLAGSFMGGGVIKTEVPADGPAEVTLGSGKTLAGGWEIPFYKEPGMNENASKAFEKGMEGWVGVGYIPISLLGTQVVAGTNYAFLCLATSVTAEPVEYWAIVYMNEDLEGNVRIMDITSLVPSLSGQEVGGEIPDPALLGGWAIPEDKSLKDNENEEFFTKAMEGLLGVKYIGEALLGTQVVAGKNYAYLAEATAVVPDAQPQWKIVYIWEKADGTIEVTDIHDLNLGVPATAE